MPKVTQWTGDGLILSQDSLHEKDNSRVSTTLSPFISWEGSAEGLIRDVPVSCGESSSEADLDLRAAVSAWAWKDHHKNPARRLCPLLWPWFSHRPWHGSSTLACCNTLDFLNAFSLKRAVEKVHHVLFGKPPSAPRIDAFMVPVANRAHSLLIELGNSDKVSSKCSKRKWHMFWEEHW